MAFAHLFTQPSLFLLLLLFHALPILHLFCMKKKKNKVSSEAKLPPGPAQLPIIGNLHLLAGGKSPHRTMWELSKRYGPLVQLKLGRVPALVVSSAAMAKEVLKTHDADACNRPPGIPFMMHSFGYSDIAFASYDDEWKKRQRICKEEFFSNKKLASFTSIIQEEIDWTMRWLASRSKDSPTVNVSQASCFLFNSIVCRAALGRSCHDNAGDMRIHNLLKENQAMTGSFFVGDFLPQFGWVDFLTGMRGRLRKNFLELDSFYNEAIHEHEELNHRRGNLLDALLHVMKNKKEMTENEIKGILMDILVAGTGTSWSVVEWSMTELMRHPEVMRRVQEELRSCVVGGKGKVEKSDLGQLRYLKAVIKESMRLHPPVPLLIPRESVRGFKLQGYDVAPNTTIFINVFAIRMDPASWERPEEFIPERFMVDQGSNGSSINGIELTSHHDFKLLTFGEGRRICPGMNLGVLMTELALANLLYCFNWSLPAGMAVEDIDMDEATGTTVHKSTAVHLVAQKYEP